MKGSTHNKNSQQGFTFVETLVAISILLLAVAAPLTLGSQGLTASRIARDQVTATLLAQETIEYARYLRDTNTLNGGTWLEGLDQCIDTPCAVDVPNGGVIDEMVCERDESSCPMLTFNTETGFYGLADAGGNVQPTKYRRSFTIELTENVEAHLIAKVAWKDGLTERSVTVEDYIYDWQ